MIDNLFSYPEKHDFVLSEVYAESVNNGRTYTNVQMVYDRIKIDFYHKLNQE
jgi:hypothetical protein